jgi:hypothetical protein
MLLNFTSFIQNREKFKPAALVFCRRPVYYYGMSKRALKPDTRTDSRGAILEAGTRVILKKGYYQCGLAEILQEAGVPKGSFYYYFPSK